MGKTSSDRIFQGWFSNSVPMLAGALVLSPRQSLRREPSMFPPKSLEISERFVASQCDSFRCCCPIPKETKISRWVFNACHLLIESASFALRFLFVLSLRPRR